jgi:transcriptional regulator with XRE-family HTH domain
MGSWAPMSEPPRSDAEEQKDPDLVALGARVRSLRLAAGMTQEGVAHAADLHWTYIGQIERGERNPTYKSLLRLASGLGIEPSGIMRDES